MRHQIATGTHRLSFPKVKFQSPNETKENILAGTFNWTRTKLLSRLDKMSDSGSEFHEVNIFNPREDWRHIQHLDITIDTKTFSDAQDDMLAISLRHFHMGHNLKSVTITITSGIVFTRDTYVVSLSSTPDDEQRAKWSAGNMTWRMIEKKQMNIMVLEKAIVSALLGINNVPLVKIYGPIEAELYQLLMSAMSIDTSSESVSSVDRRASTASHSESPPSAGSSVLQNPPPDLDMDNMSDISELTDLTELESRISPETFNSLNFPVAPPGPPLGFGIGVPDSIDIISFPKPINEDEAHTPATAEARRRSTRSGPHTCTRRKNQLIVADGRNEYLVQDEEFTDYDKCNITWAVGKGTGRGDQTLIGHEYSQDVEGRHTEIILPTGRAARVVMGWSVDSWF